jgi:hypothetical protein
MGSFRVRLPDEFRIRLFSQILQNDKVTIIELSRKLGSGYSATKNWKNGKRLIPGEVLCKLLYLSSADLKNEFKHIEVREFPENWGASLGGIITAERSKNFMKKKMDRVRDFRTKQIKFPIVDEEIWELVGACLGDGCLTKYFSTYENRFLYETIFTGNLTDDFYYYKDRIIPILRSRFNLKGYYYTREKYHVICIPIRSRAIFDFFASLGMPIGKKKNKIRITKNMFSMSKQNKAAVLRGLFDTDGHMFARKDEGYKYLHIKITSGSYVFLKDIKALMNEFDLPAYIHGTDVIIRGNSNIKTWMEKIGSSHPVNIKRYNQWQTTRMLLPKRGS